MKQVIYILTLTLGLYSCNNKAIVHSKNKSIATLASSIQKHTELVTKSDSVVFFWDSLFASLKLELKEISGTSFQGYEKKYKPACALDSNGFITGKGLVFKQSCNNMCESYLVDQKENIKLILPSEFDAGIKDLLFSPSCNQFVVYSSYDGPDYTNYYQYRAEITGFTITEEQGVKAIKPSFKYYTTDWSIDNLTWIDNTTLALKLYSGGKSAKAESLKYSYFKAILK